ncbi:MAG: hypothetical protein AAF998_29500 [Bacteroidota bacterium]
MSNQVHQAAHVQHAGQFDAEGMQSVQPPEFSVTASSLASDNFVPPPDSGDTDLTGKRLLIRIDTTLYRTADNSQPLCAAKRNSEVMVIDDCRGNDWAQVQIIGGPTGFVNRNHLLKRDHSIHTGTKLHRVEPPTFRNSEDGTLTHDTDMTRQWGTLYARPNPKTGEQEHYRMIKSGDTLEQIIIDSYPDTQGLDRRTIANVIVHLNQGNAGIRIKDGGITGALAGSVGHNFDRIELLANYDILIPSWETVLSLKDLVASGSISTGLVQKFWPDGWGCSISVEAGAALVALAGEGGFDAYFFRRGNHLAIHFAYKLGAGVSVGAGAGLMIKKKGKKRGFGVRAGVDAELMGTHFGMIEFEIPLQAGVVVDYLKGLGGSAFGSDAEMQDGAEEFVGGFDGDPYDFVNKALVQNGVRAGFEAGAGAGVMEAGKDVETRNQGNGTETATSTAQNGNRTSQDESVGRYVGTISAKLKRLKKDGLRGVGEDVLSDLVQSIAGLCQVGIGAEAGFAYGIEYEKSPRGEKQMSLFLEGYGWAQVDLPLLPALRFGIGAGTRLVFTQRRGSKLWSTATPESYLYGGNLDNYTAGAYELSVATGEMESRNPTEDMFERLKTVKFKKRFMVNLMTGSLGRRKRALQGIKSLVSSDGKTFGLEGLVALTLEVDLANLKTGDQSFRDEFLTEAKKFRSNGIVDTISSLVDTLIAEGSGSKGVSLLSKLINPTTVTNCTFHAEGSIGFALSGRVGAGAKLQVDLGASVGLVYEKSFSGNEVFTALDQMKKEFDFRPDEHLATTFGGHDAFRADFTLDFLNGAEATGLL